MGKGALVIVIGEGAGDVLVMMVLHSSRNAARMGGEWLDGRTGRLVFADWASIWKGKELGSNARGLLRVVHGRRGRWARARCSDLHSSRFAGCWIVERTVWYSPHRLRPQLHPPGSPR